MRLVICLNCKGTEVILKLIDSSDKKMDVIYQEHTMDLISVVGMLHTNNIHYSHAK